MSDAPKSNETETDVSKGLKPRPPDRFDYSNKPRPPEKPKPKEPTGD